ncbi:MAG: hypothetical protein Q8R25_05100 [bacterium]|nr:hypothetical protein [bacterium]
MKEIILYIVVGLGGIFGFYYLSSSGSLAPVPGLGFILGTSAILQLWVAVRLTQAWARLGPNERAADPLLNQMRWLFTVGGIFLAYDVIPHVVLIMNGVDIRTITIAHWTGHLVLFVYLILAARLAVSFFNPQWKNRATIFVTLIGLAALAVSAAKPDFLVEIPGSAYPFLQSDRLYAFFNMLLNVSAAGIFGAYLILMGLLKARGLTRVRSLLFGLGLLSLVVGGFLIQYSHSKHTAIMITVSFTLWSLLTGLSALYGSIWKSSRIG